MKKILALMCGLAMISGCTACSEKGGSSAVPVSSPEQTLYKEDKLPVPDDFNYPKALIPTVDGRLMFIYNDMYFADRAVLYDPQLNMGESFAIEREEGEGLLFYALSDSEIRTLSSRISDSGTVLSVNTYSTDGKVTSTTELGDLGGRLDGKNDRIINACYRGGDCLITLDSAAVIADGSGNPYGRLLLRTQARNAHLGAFGDEGL